MFSRIVGVVMVFACALAYFFEGRVFNFVEAQSTTNSASLLMCLVLPAAGIFGLLLIREGAPGRPASANPEANQS